MSETQIDTKHHWIKHTMTPVHVLEGSEGEPVVMVDPDQQTISEDAAVYGCERCGEAMSTHFGKPCSGEDH